MRTKKDNVLYDFLIEWTGKCIYVGSKYKKCFILGYQAYGILSKDTQNTSSSATQNKTKCDSCHVCEILCICLGKLECYGNTQEIGKLQTARAIKKPFLIAAVSCW